MNVLECIECKSTEDVHQKLGTCYACIHSYWIENHGPRTGRAGRPAVNEPEEQPVKKRKPRPRANPAMTPEELEDLRRDLNVTLDEPRAKRAG